MVWPMLALTDDTWADASWRRTKMNTQGWPLPDDGAQRAASSTRASVAGGIGSPRTARGLWRRAIKGWSMTALSPRTTGSSAGAGAVTSGTAAALRS